MILFESRDIDDRLVKALRKFGINSTGIYPQHSAPPEVLENSIRTSMGIGYQWAHAQVVALGQVERVFGLL
jgi:hypothetical protein